MFGGFPEFAPSLASYIFRAEAAKLNFSLLDGAVVKRARCTHSEFALAPSTLALGFPVVRGTEFTGESADANFRIAGFQVVDLLDISIFVSHKF